MAETNRTKDKVHGIGVREPRTQEEIAGKASRVEQYRCETCSLEIDFPRYNDPVKLMTWRKGRCGEWANCFCALAVAAGFRTRFIVDFTDHVWGEVFSPDQNRWIHCDPCENAFDSPLMYEQGWGKKLSFVLAFESLGVCVDVTRRYSRSWDREMIQRRLDSFSKPVSNLLLNHQPATGLESSELEEFAKCVKDTLPAILHGKKSNVEPHLKPEEAKGRISGSEEWRRARGEYGDAQKEFKARHRTLVDSGMSANQAAVKALQEMMEEKKKHDEQQ